MADVSQDQGETPSRRPALRPFSGRTQSAGQGALRPLGARRPAVSPLAATSAPTPSGDVAQAVGPAPVAENRELNATPDEAVIAATERAAESSLLVTAAPAEAARDSQAIAEVPESSAPDAAVTDGMPTDDMEGAAPVTPSALDVSTLEPDATGNRELVTFESPYDDVTFGVARGDAGDPDEAEDAYGSIAMGAAWDGAPSEAQDVAPAATGVAASGETCAEAGPEAGAEAGAEAGIEAGVEASMERRDEGHVEAPWDPNHVDPWDERSLEDRDAWCGETAQGDASDHSASAGFADGIAAADASSDSAGAGDVSRVAPYMTGGFAEFVVDDSAYADMDDDLLRCSADAADGEEPESAGSSLAYGSTDTDALRDDEDQAAVAYTTPALHAMDDGARGFEDESPRWEGTTAALEPATLEAAALEPAALEPAALEPAALEPAALEAAAASAGGDAPVGADADQAVAGEQAGWAPVRATEVQSHAADVLQMVAERVRGGEIVASTDANASPEAVLASVLASLLSART